jgi:hypothetical protein
MAHGQLSASVVTITRAGPDAACNLRELAIMQVICPTCQIVSEKPQAVMPVARLLCMGLFSIFLVGAACPKLAKRAKHRSAFALGASDG